MYINNPTLFWPCIPERGISNKYNIPSPFRNKTFNTYLVTSRRHNFFPHFFSYTEY